LGDWYCGRFQGFNRALVNRGRETAPDLFHLFGGHRFAVFLAFAVCHFGTPSLFWVNFDQFEVVNVLFFIFRGRISGLNSSNTGNLLLSVLIKKAILIKKDALFALYSGLSSYD
jgi:hypothetical protein